MAQGIEYALAAMVCFGLADFVYRRAAEAGVQAHHFLMLQAWFFAPTVILYGVLSGTLAFETPALWGAAAGLFVYTGLRGSIYSACPENLGQLSPFDIAAQSLSADTGDLGTRMNPAFKSPLRIAIIAGAVPLY
ncbi:MAG TPA: hypothetical protein VGQ88_10765 [Burkholderiales bacterium]|nr:hypothetical protein [Burkholderiales bacterium]